MFYNTLNVKGIALRNKFMTEFADRHGMKRVKSSVPEDYKTFSDVAVL